MARSWGWEGKRGSGSGLKWEVLAAKVRSLWGRPLATRQMNLLADI